MERHKKYPDWCCVDCGKRYGRFFSKKRLLVSTFHIDFCGICKKQTQVTEPRDFGHLNEKWQFHPNQVETDIPLLLPPAIDNNE